MEVTVSRVGGGRLQGGGVCKGGGGRVPCLSRKNPLKTTHLQKRRGVQNSGPWDQWLPVVENSRLFAQRTVRPLTPPPPPSKHGQGQKNNGHTGPPCLDKPVLARDVQHKKTLHIENLPVPHTKHITHKHGTRTRSVGKILHGPRVVTAHQQVWNRNPFQPCTSF